MNGRALASAINESANEEVRDQYRKFAMDTLSEAKRILRYGTPGAKERLVRSIVPTVVRDTLSEKAQDEDDGLSELRDRMDALHETIKRDIASQPDDDETFIDLTEDAPDE